MNLKDRGIYQLPNGRELIARVTKTKAVLITLTASDAGQYQLSVDGRLLFNGQRTAWSEDDLSDTGRVAPADLINTMVEAMPADGEMVHEPRIG